ALPASARGVLLATVPLTTGEPGPLASGRVVAVAFAARRDPLPEPPSRDATATTMTATATAVAPAMATTPRRRPLVNSVSAREHRGDSAHGGHNAIPPTWPGRPRPGGDSRHRL